MNADTVTQKIIIACSTLIACGLVVWYHAVRCGNWGADCVSSLSGPRSGLLSVSSGSIDAIDRPGGINGSPVAEVSW